MNNCGSRGKRAIPVSLGPKTWYSKMKKDCRQLGPPYPMFRPNTIKRLVLTNWSTQQIDL